MWGKGGNWFASFLLPLVGGKSSEISCWVVEAAERQTTQAILCAKSFGTHKILRNRQELALLLEKASSSHPKCLLLLCLSPRSRTEMTTGEEGLGVGKEPSPLLVFPEFVSEIDNSHLHMPPKSLQVL